MKKIPLEKEYNSKPLPPTKSDKSFKKFMNDSLNNRVTKKSMDKKDRKDAAEALADIELKIEKEKLSKTQEASKGGYIKKYAKGGGVRAVRY